MLHYPAGLVFQRFVVRVCVFVLCCVVLCCSVVYVRMCCPSHAVVPPTLAELESARGDSGVSVFCSELWRVD